MLTSPTISSIARRAVRWTTLPLVLAVICSLGLVSAPAQAASKPVLTSMSATAGPEAGGRTITITGKYFTQTSQVLFGSTYAKTVRYSSSTKLTVDTPPHAAGRVDVRVKTSAGTSSITSAGSFTYRKIPVISKLSPDTGPGKGGTTVTIDGKYYTSSTKVRFGAIYSTQVKKVSSTRLTAVAPAGVIGHASVQVKSSGGWSVASDANTFTYTAPPALTSLSVTEGSPSGGEPITIRGTAFTPDSTVDFGGTPATSVRVASSTELTAVIPAHPIEQVQVTVTTPSGSSPATSAGLFQYGDEADRLFNVGSFNVRVGSGYDSSRGPNEERWKLRVPVVVSQIKREKLDVIGVQEASASTKHTATGVPQFQDIVNRLGSPYKITNTHRYCYEADKSGRCKTGASNSDRIIYNSSRLTMINQGARKLDNRSATDGSGRYVAWATFKDQRTGKSFFFVNTHLEPNKNGAYNGAVRSTQMAIILDEIDVKNPSDLPVVFAGDLATSKFDSQNPSNIAHTMLTDAGFLDPLINTYKYKGAETLVAEAVNVRYNSLNYFQPTPLTVHESYAIGSYVDYILIRGALQMTAWHTVVDVDENGRFTGVIPSDHNLITLTVGLL